MKHLHKSGYPLWCILLTCLFLAGCTPEDIKSRIQSVTTNYVTNVTGNEATFSGSVSVEDADVVTCGIIYGTLSSLSEKNGRRIETTSNGYYSLSVSGLKPSTTYYYRAYAVDNEHYTYGDEYSFETSDEYSPETSLQIYVTTDYTTNITDSEATIYCTIHNSNSEWITCGIIYGTSYSLEDAESTMIQTSSCDQYSISLSGLYANTTYYYRAYAIVDGEYIYGDIYSFHTEQGAEQEPVITSGNAIDLGLSVKWASCNIGAISPESYGGYYAWGEIEEKSYYDWSNYKWSYGSTSSLTKYSKTKDNKTSLDPEDDVAHILLGDGWRMPTLLEAEELKNNCTWTSGSINGVEGQFVTGPNGNSIFIPAAGYYYNDELCLRGSYGVYRVREINASDNRYALSFSFGSDNRNWADGSRFAGYPVRPVKDEANTSDKSKEKTYTVNGISFTMISIEGGTFTMGATSEQGDDAYSDEYPTHQVTLDGYFIGETEVTQELWKAVMGTNPSANDTGDLQHPVDFISWDDCQDFIDKLNELTGETFRLPTEAEWEYAARGGNKSCSYKYSGSNSINDVAWYSSSASHPVKTKQANELGVYDMSGNVQEWCSDWYFYDYYSSSPENNPTGPSASSYRVLRGGSWTGDARVCRVTYRIGNYPYDRDYNQGLRLAR